MIFGLWGKTLNCTLKKEIYSLCDYNRNSIWIHFQAPEGGVEEKLAVGDGETKIAMDEYGLEYDQYAEGMSSCIKLRITKKRFCEN